MNSRAEIHARVSKVLGEQNNAQLRELIANGDRLHSGIGGNSHRIVVEGVPIFVKRIAVSHFELESNNSGSTENIFGLPLAFHYGIGSAGFSAWRELAVHELTTEWVLSGRCPSFPLMYLSRLDKNVEPPKLNLEEWGGSVDEFVKFWDNAESVRTRATSINSANAELLLFLEYVPHNLYSWLGEQFRLGPQAAQAALEFAERELEKCNNFMCDNQFIHFDAHFANVLTNGKQIFLSDFGLSLMEKFGLNWTELNFLSTHQKSYDRSMAALNLVHTAITLHYGKENWRERFSEHCKGKLLDLPTHCEPTLHKHGTVAAEVASWLRTLRQAPTKIPYPAEKLEQLLRASSPQ